MKKKFSFRYQIKIIQFGEDLFFFFFCNRMVKSKDTIDSTFLSLSLKSCIKTPNLFHSSSSLCSHLINNATQLLVHKTNPKICNNREEE